MPRHDLGLACLALLGLAQATWRPLLGGVRHTVVVDKPQTSKSEGSVAWTQQLHLAGKAAHCEVRDALPDEKHKEDLAARWAPLRHRCHAWRRKVNESGVPWDYRICFNSDVVAWAPKPFLQRVDLGWYNSSYDEDHPNGSVSLHYVNSITRGEVVLRCHCGQGPEITSWSTGHNHTLHLALPTCCRLAHEDGARSMSVPEIFHWLLAPVARLEQPCLGLKRGSWDYTLCFEENISQASLSRAPATAEGKVAPEVLLAGPPPPEVVPHLVTAEPVVRGQSVDIGAGLSSDDGSAEWAAVPAKLAEALGSQRRRALELDLAEGQDCRAANGTRKHHARVRWLCPATWRSVSPDLDGGHTALLAVERPSGCDWVVWLASTLLCTWRPLRPSSRTARQVQCLSVKQQVPSPVPKKPEGDTPVRPAAPKLPVAFEVHGDRTGVRFHVGQLVSVSDGTVAVVLAWDVEPREDVLAQRQVEVEKPPAGVHYLIVASRGHLPATGALNHGVLDLPGHAAYVAEETLVAETEIAYVPGRFPAGLTRFLDEQGRPRPWLAKLYPADGADTAESPAGASNWSTSIEDRLQDVVARFGALKAASLEDVGSAPIPRSESKDDFMDLGPDVVEDYMEDIVDFDAYNEL